MWCYCGDKSEEVVAHALIGKLRMLGDLVGRVVCMVLSVFVVFVVGSCCC